MAWNHYTKVVFWGMTNITSLPLPVYQILDETIEFRLTSPTYPGNEGFFVFRQVAANGALAGEPGAHERCEGCADCDAENHFGNQDEAEDPPTE
jgi:hypothetical protein